MLIATDGHISLIEVITLTARFADISMPISITRLNYQPPHRFKFHIDSPALPRYGMVTIAQMHYSTVGTNMAR
jgi:hypothetical protein